MKRALMIILVLVLGLVAVALCPAESDAIQVPWTDGTYRLQGFEDAEGETTFIEENENYLAWFSTTEVGFVLMLSDGTVFKFVETEKNLYRDFEGDWMIFIFYREIVCAVLNSSSGETAYFMRQVKTNDLPELPPVSSST